MKVKPKGKYVLLKVTEYEDTGSIFIPEKYRKKIPKGTVLAKGDCCEANYEVGQVVIYKKSGTKLINEDEVMCHEDNILLKGS